MASRSVHTRTSCLSSGYSLLGKCALIQRKRIKTEMAMTSSRDCSADIKTRPTFEWITVQHGLQPKGHHDLSVTGLKTSSISVENWAHYLCLVWLPNNAPHVVGVGGR